MVKAKNIGKSTVVAKGDKCLDCGKKISQKKFAEQEGLCDKCHGPFLEDVSQEEYPEEIFGDL
jgi:Zn finger protein HypA/HybF involved in hydrogenase expression